MTYPMSTDIVHWPFEYRNTIAGSPPSERIFIYLGKTRFASQKTEFLNFCFLAKQININDLKWLRNNKRFQKPICFYFGFFVFIIL